MGQCFCLKSDELSTLTKTRIHLPIRLGGLGVRKLSHVRFAEFIGGVMDGIPPLLRWRGTSWEIKQPLCGTLDRRELPYVRTCFVEQNHLSQWKRSRLRNQSCLHLNVQRILVNSKVVIALMDSLISFFSFVWYSVLDGAWGSWPSILLLCDRASYSDCIWLSISCCQISYRPCVFCHDFFCRIAFGFVLLISSKLGTLRRILRRAFWFVSASWTDPSFRSGLRELN